MTTWDDYQAATPERQIQIVAGWKAVASSPRTWVNTTMPGIIEYDRACFNYTRAITGHWHEDDPLRPRKRGIGYGAQPSYLIGEGNDDYVGT